MTKSSAEFARRLVAEAARDFASAADRGFALLIVTIILAALSLIIASSLATTRQREIAVSGAVERLQLDSALDAALASAEGALARADGAPLLAPGIPTTISSGGYKSEILVVPASARLDLNFASPSTLAAFFTAADLDRAPAGRLSDQIVRWRSGRPLNDTHAERSSRDPAEDATAPHRFVSVDELALLPDGSRDIADCLRPDLTVFSGVTDADPALASSRLRPVLASHPRASTQSLLSATAAAAGTMTLATSPGEVFDVTVRATDPENGATAAEEIVLRTTGSLAKPIWIISRSRLSEESQSAACARIKAQHPAVRA